MRQIRAGALLALLWSLPGLAGPASAALLRVVYPGFDSSGYRAHGRRVGWTQVQPWKARPGFQVLLVEKFEGEIAPLRSEAELVVLEGGAAAPRVVARRSGWRGYQSREYCGRSCGHQLVGLDLGDFAFCPDEVALGVVTESVSGEGEAEVHLRELELFRLKDEALVPLARLPMRETRADGATTSWALTLMARRREPCRDLSVRAKLPDGTLATRLFRWNGEGYVEEPSAQ